MRTRYALLAVALLAAVVLSGCTTKVVTTNGAAPLYMITASGTGRSMAAPDTAQMFFGATVVADDAKTALDEASRAADAITAAVKNAGVDAKDIQTANISVWPEQSGDGDRLRVTGYRASIQVRVDVRDLENIGAVIGAASDAGANEIGGPNFMLSDDADTRNEAIEAAIADARDRGKVMAKAAGKELGEIISVMESGGGIPPIYYGERAAMDASVPVEPGQMEVATTVTVVFELK